MANAHPNDKGLVVNDIASISFHNTVLFQKLVCCGNGGIQLHFYLKCRPNNLHKATGSN